MSDDIWRRRDDTDRDVTAGDATGDEYGTDFGSEFGRIQFADEPTNEPALSFGNDTTGSLPHWNESPTGEAPTMSDDTGGEPDVWATFQQPSAPTQRPGRLTIGTDPTDERARRPAPPPRDSSFDMVRDPSYDITGGHSRPQSRSAQVRRSSGGGGRSGRDMPAAVSTGLILVAVFVAAEMWRPAAVMVIVIAALGMAAVEFFSKVTEKGYRPATFAGIAACVASPLAAYWMGDGSLPLVIAFSFMAASIGFIGAGSVQSGPMPNVAITTMSVVWIGLLGSFAALILRMSVSGSVPAAVGTDTLFIVVAAVVANDVGGLLVGSTAGRTPLREWISPNKTVEGVVGGTLLTVIVVVLVGTQSDTWNNMGELLLLALVVSVMAPLGDLVESMFKRNLDVKDFGSVIAGHGGVLDRFDGFLFVLPSAYYLLLVLQPWTA